MGGGRYQPPVGGHRGDGRSRDGVYLVPLLSLVGWVCSSGAQKEGKNSTTVWSVYILEAPFSARPESWLVVARGASAPLRLVGHLGWVHQQEARAVGEPRERMGGRRERRMTAEIGAGLVRKTRILKSQASLTAHWHDKGADWRGLAHTQAHHRSRLSDSVKNGNALRTMHNAALPAR